jgi:formylglycine-generating enzyme required for sulfatase activity
MPTRDADPMSLQEEVSTASGNAAPEVGATTRASRPRAVNNQIVKILFFSANAVPDKHLAVDEEHRAIDQALQKSRHREAFQVISQLAARDGDLQQALLHHDPDIVHFACHGNVEAELLLLAADGGTAAVPQGSLTAMLKALRGNVALVVFNACWSREQAEAIRHSAGLAIGMCQPIGDAEAIKFADAFYNALGHGRSVRNAFDWGVAAIKPNRPSSDIPQLFEANDGRAASTVFVRQLSWVRRHVALLVAGALLAMAGTLLAARSPTSSPPPGPPANMVRILGGALRHDGGPRDLALFPAACRTEGAIEDCTEPLPVSSQEDHVATFDLDRTEVTNRQFAAWLQTQADAWQVNKNGEIVTRQTQPVALALISAKCGEGIVVNANGQLRVEADKGEWPVICVTWHGANEYCRAQGKRLPLAIEWDLAARGPEGRLFPWGAALPLQDGVAFELDYGATRHPRPVGTSSQDVTPQGVRDLGGNVAEWIEDGRGDTSQKTLRGGTWGSGGPCHLLGTRCRRLPTESYQADLGFRCARSVLGQPSEGKVSP